MEKSEPSLIPEWLKSGGSLTDNHSALRHARNKLSVDSDGDIGRTSVLDRASSAYFRRSSSSKGSSDSWSYSNFPKGNWERDWEKFTNVHHDRKNAVFSDHGNRIYSDSVDNLLPSISEKDVLQRSKSMITGKRSDTWPRKATNEFSSNRKSHHSSGNGKLSTAVREKSASERDFHSLGAEERLVGSEVGRVSSPGLINKSEFERDFPSLGAEERQFGSELGRVSSPGLKNPVQSLPLGTSPGIGSDCRTSALADIPVGVGSSGRGVAIASPNVCACSTPTVTMGLNMAEAVAQGPTRARTPPLLNVETQRLEELAIKQSRQLIPLVTISTPKTLVASPSEKSKPKVGQQLRPSVSVNSTRGGTSRSDGIKISSESRLCILKPSRESNGVSLVTTKDNLSPTNGSNKLVNSPLSFSPSAAASAPFRSSGNSPRSAPAERNQTQLRLTMEKRATAQAQSRNDFFNLLKKKSTTDSASSVLVPRPAVSQPVSENLDELGTEDSNSAVTLKDAGVLAPEISIADLPTDNRSEMALNGDAYTEPQHCSTNGDGHSRPDVFLYPDEEEAAFLRSLGWEENAGDDDGLTEAEINAFLEQYSKLKPSAKLFQRMQSMSPLNSHNGTHGDVSSGLRTMDSNVEALTRGSSN
ncbi:WRKY DNA-binding protein 9, putative isoform 1 [Hibiscus syriacus]|uniref:WRKY DNA-binding protein 9, putative isoform 1 n=1 Tax=Hibiscus syriacus TaxID=106335 RepID=A0A6A3C9Y0_HIBSY|nr:WRKY DNA-binding protein 9, putative isoform 1 [Hibiscus syriacus]